jgi:hypothetical protein
MTFTEKRREFPTVEMLRSFKTSSYHDMDHGVQEAWVFFATELMPNVKPGRFQAHKAMNKGEYGRVYTVSDEAFVMWVVDVYKPKWDKHPSLTQAQRRALGSVKGARSQVGIPQLSKEDHKKFKDWYKIVQEGRSSIHLQGWMDVLAEEEEDLISDSRGHPEDMPLVQDESEDDDFPLDSIDNTAEV